MEVSLKLQNIKIPKAYIFTCTTKQNCKETKSQQTPKHRHLWPDLQCSLTEISVRVTNQQLQKAIIPFLRAPRKKKVFEVSVSSKVYTGIKLTRFLIPQIKHSSAQYTERKAFYLSSFVIIMFFFEKELYLTLWL